METNKLTPERLAEIRKHHADDLARIAGFGIEITSYPWLEVERDLLAHISALEAELKLAIAHDRQPYPTAEAYEKVCQALNKKTDRIAVLEAELKEAQTQKATAFDQGFVLAVAEIMRQHGEDVIARDVLNANRPRDWGIIDQYDLNALKPIFEHEAAQAEIHQMRSPVHACGDPDCIVPHPPAHKRPPR